MKRLTICLQLVLLSLFPFAMTATAFAATNPFNGGSFTDQNNVNEDVCTQPGTNTSPVCNTNGSNPLTGSNGVIGKATRIISIIAGMAAIVMIVVGGFMFITAGGDANKVETARNTVVGSAIGLLIIIVARTIVLFVASKI